MRLGYIDYLNCYPFYYHMFEKKAVKDVTIVPGYPGDLNEMMLGNELDMSPISSAAFPDMQDHAILLPQFCLSSIGYVRSVVLMSSIPIEDLDGKKIGITSASKTSAILLQILMNKYYGVTAEYITIEPDPSLHGCDAALIIGNEALMESRQPVQYSYDLGDIWLRKTGYPVVFAVFALQDAAVEDHSDVIDEVVDSFKHSLGDLKADRKTIIEKAGKKYPNIHYSIDEYFKLLKYEFTSELKEALLFFYEEAASLHLLPSVNGMEFFRD